MSLFGRVSGIHRRLALGSLCSLTMFPPYCMAQLRSVGAEFHVNTYVSTYYSSQKDFPAVAADSEGDFVVVWDSYAQDGDGTGVFAQRYYSVGVAAGTEFQVNSSTMEYQSYPDVAVDADGDFVVTWVSCCSSNAIFAQRYDSAGNPVGGEFQVSAFTSAYNYIGRPDVALDADGDFVVAWSTYLGNGSGTGVFAKRYISTGSPVGTEFAVDSYGVGYQEEPSVAADANGNFVIVWQSDAQTARGARSAASSRSIATRLARRASLS
jgi:hypothetical protein